jgi:hypothetical protein
MKTRFLLLLVLFTFGFGLMNYANNVELQDAQKVATNFYFEKMNQYVSPTNYTDLQITNIIEHKDGSETVLYVFQFNNKGFVIVPAEDALNPVIGYSFVGNFPANLDYTTNYGSFILSYIEQINYAKENNVAATSEVSDLWKHILTDDILQLITQKGAKDVEPLLTSTWNQDSPYNILCPANASGPGGHVYAGCVATAMSFIMHYWRYPSVGQGTHSYYIYPYGTLTANFGATEYNWNGMQNDIQNSNPNPIAELQYHAGVSVDMNYAPDGSGAYSEDVDNALRNYFRYGAAVFIEKNNYSQTQWINILKGDIDQGHPLYYSGRTTDNAGHAFGCDGYDDDNLFHFNFGWSGSGNGFYALTNVGGFYVDQAAIKNFYPTDGDYPYYSNGHTDLTNRSGSFTDGSGPLENYLDNASASWLINPQTVEDSITDITISFYEFDLGANDELIIYDGEDASATVVGTYTGTDIPETFTSTGNKLYITFTSDGSVTGSGFYAEYETSSPSYCNGMTVYTEPTGTFSDGSNTFNYNNNSVCMWRIEPAWASEITLTFTSFNTEEGDFFKVYQGSTLVGEYSGDEIPDPVTVTGGMMFITFASNSSTTAPGWEVYYEINNVGVEESGTFEYLNVYPNPAKDNITIVLQAKEIQDISIDLMTITGEIIISENSEVSGKFTKSLDISSLSKGVYFLRIINKKGIVNKKIVVN